MEPIRPIDRTIGVEGAAPVPAIRRLTPKEREEAAQERQRRRRAREQAAGRASGEEQHPEGTVSLDVRA
jgi:hypothetical protein